MKRFSKITTTQLARICGVSQGTVDRALHNRGEINPKTKEYILSVAREYDYKPSLPVSGEQGSMLIGVVLFDLYNEFFSKLAMSLVHAAKQVGYSIIFQFSGKDAQTERKTIDYFDCIGVDGIILFSVGSDSIEYKNYLRSLKKPLVLIGNRLFDLPYVGIDDRQAMRELAEQFAERVEHGEILYYAPSLNKPLHSQNAQRLRLAGFEEAMVALGRSYRIVTDPSGLENFGGIVCATDYYALNALTHLGYPQEIAIAGFDNLSLLRNLRTNILTVDYATDQIAEECLNYILGRSFHSTVGHRTVYNNDEKSR